MIIKFKIFESEENPDLRKLSTYVRCIKNYFFQNKLTFYKDNIYKIDGLYGDPQGAAEKYNIQDYIPIELIESIIISHNNEKFRFTTNTKLSSGKIVAIFHGRYTTSDDGIFWEYFELLSSEEDEFYKLSNKYNL